MNKIKELRKHMKKKEIAKALKVSLTTIDRWEDEISKPTQSNQNRIDKLYNTLGGERE